MTEATLLELEDVSMEFPGVKALDGVSFAVRPGEVHALVGENGAGKSTLIKILAGVWPHGSFKGKLLVNGVPAAFRGVRDARRAGLAVIHQELELVPEMTVAENISLGEEPAAGPFVRHDLMHKRAVAALKELGMRVRPDAAVSGLGTGARQAVEIARSLSRQFRVLVLDEPTAALSEAETETLLKLIRRLKASGAGIVYISHRLKEVCRIADRITVLRDGKTVASGYTPEFSQEKLIRDMVGRTIDGVFPPKTKRRAGGVALRAEGINVGGGPFDFNVSTGEIVGVAGLVGSGRTSLLETLFGLRPLNPDARIMVGPTAVRIRSPRDAIRAGLALVPEDRKGSGLVPGAPVRENLTLASLELVSAGPLIRHAFEAEQAASTCRTWGVKTLGTESPVENLSGGNQQKIALAKWFPRKPRVLLLDEPTRGVDVGAKSEIYAIIRRLAAEGAALVVASSELVELIGLCDRIVAFSDRRPVANFAAEKATQESLMEAMAEGVTE